MSNNINILVPRGIRVFIVVGSEESGVGQDAKKDEGVEVLPFVQPDDLRTEGVLVVHT